MSWKDECPRETEGGFKLVCIGGRGATARGRGRALSLGWWRFCREEYQGWFSALASLHQAFPNNLPPTHTPTRTCCPGTIKARALPWTLVAQADDTSAYWSKLRAVQHGKWNCSHQEGNDGPPQSLRDPLPFQISRLVESDLAGSSLRRWLLLPGVLRVRPNPMELVTWEVGAVVTKPSKELCVSSACRFLLCHPLGLTGADRD